MAAELLEKGWDLVLGGIEVGHRRGQGGVYSHRALVPWQARMDSCLSGQSETKSQGSLSACGLPGMGIWDATCQEQTVPSTCDDDIQGFSAVSQLHLPAQGVCTTL